MKRSKVIQVLGSFTSTELLSFQQFLEAACLHGTSGTKKAQQLFQLIKKYHPSFDHPSLKKETIYSALFPKSDYRVGRLEKCQSSLFRQIQAFVLFKQTESQTELQQQAVLYSFFSKKKLTNLADAHIKRFRKIVKEEKQPSSIHFYECFLFEELMSENEVLMGGAQKPKHISVALQNLDHYYLLEKLDLACRLLSFNNLIIPMDIGEDLKTIELFTPLLEEDYFDVPLIKVYYKAYKLLKNYSQDNEQVFADFEEVVLENEDKIPLAQIKLLNAIIRNYSIVQYNKGVENFLPKAFQLYQKDLAGGYLYYENKILFSTLSNIVVFGLRLKKYEWVWEFIQSHKNKITGITDPEGAFKLTLANYYFYTADYEKAIDALSYNNEDTYFRLIGKRLEIRIYYETKHVLLTPRMDAFKIYIYRLNANQISPKQKIGNRNFIDLLKQIHLPKTFQNPKRIDKLIEKIKGLDSITDKVWLLEKLEELR